MNSSLSSLIEPLGWALLHFLWQGTAVALLLSGCLRLARKCSPQTRYAAAGAALLLMVGAAAATVWWQARNGPADDPDLTDRSDRTEVVAVTSEAQVTGELAPAAVTDPPALAATGSETPTRTGVTEPVRLSETTAVSHGAAAQLRPLLPWMVGIWAAGVAFFSLRLLNGWRLTRRWRASGREDFSDEWRHRFSRLCAQLRITRTVRLLSSATMAVPVVIGWLKPVVLVPAGLFSGLTAAQLEALLAHELAHVRRHDYLVNLLQNVVETLFFYHPAVWWVSAQLRKEREHCCDDVATSLSGGVIDYARALTTLEEMRGVPAGLSVSAGGGSLVQRIRRLAGIPDDRASNVAWPLGLLTFATAAVALPFSLLNAAEPPFTAPQAAHVGNEKSSAYCVHDGKVTHFILISNGTFSSETRSGANPKLRTWHDEGTLTFPLGGELVFARKSDQPDQLSLMRTTANTRTTVGSVFDLSKGRIFLLSSIGVPTQMNLPARLVTERQALENLYDDIEAEVQTREDRRDERERERIRRVRTPIEANGAVDQARTAKLEAQGRNQILDMMPTAPNYGHSLVQTPDNYEMMQYLEQKNTIERTVSAMTTQLNSLMGLKGEDLISNAMLLKVEDATIQTFYPEYQKTKLELTRLAGSGFGPKHPKVIGLRLQLKQNMRSLVAAAENFKKALPVQISQAEAQLKTIKEIIDKRKTVLNSRVGHGAAPVIRGFSLAGIPSTTDGVHIADLYEPDPAHPGMFTQKFGVFEMPIYGEADEPWLKYPAQRGVFYIEFKDKTFGPISGDPMEKLKLPELLREKLREESPVDALLRLQKMIYRGDEGLHSEALRAVAYWIMQELAEPKWRFDYDDLITTAEEALKKAPAAPSAAAGAAALAHVRSLADKAKAAWEKSRVTLPDSEYQPGAAAGNDAGIIWSEPDAKGMSLGYSGLTPGATWKPGDQIEIALWIRNDGPEPVKFSWTPRVDEGLRMWATDGKGQRHEAEIIMNDTLLFPNRSRLEPGQKLELKKVTLNIVSANNDGTPPARGPDEGWHPRLVLPDGMWHFLVEARVGSFESKDGKGNVTVPAAGEWIGTLVSPEILVHCARSPVGEADQKASDLYLKAHLQLLEAKKLSGNGRIEEALKSYKSASRAFDQIASQHPKWNPKLVEFRRVKTAGIIAGLEKKRKDSGKVEQPSADEASGNAIAAIVNGRPVLRSEVDALMKTSAVELRSRITDQVEFDAEMKRLRSKALNTLIDQELILNKYAPFAATFDSKVEAETEERINKRFVDGLFKGDRRKFLEELDRNGIGYNNFREQQKKNVIVEAMLAQFARVDSPWVTDEDKAAWLKAHSDIFLVEDRQEGKTKPQAEIDMEVERRIQMERRQKASEAWLKTLREKAVIEITGEVAGDTERVSLWDEDRETPDRSLQTTAPVGRAKPGQKWTDEQLAKLPFGETHSSGLRAAWIFNPMQDTYAAGSVLKCRILIHNSGKQAIEFRTDRWHQDDQWIVKDAAGGEVKVKTTWYSGITPRQKVRLEPGQVYEVAAHGVGIGDGKYEESYSIGAIGAEIPAKPGDDLTCQWVVKLDPAWREDPNWTPPPDSPPPSLTTGTVKFKVTAADPGAAPKVGVARGTGKYDLAEGIKLQVTQTTSGKDGEPTQRLNSATIEWYAGNGQLGISWPIELMPGLKIDPIIWKRGGTALWIVHETAVRKIDFTNAADVKEQNWKWESAGDFGGAPPEARAEIGKLRPKIAQAPLPSAARTADDSLTKSKMKTITVDNDSRISLDGLAVTVQELEQKLKAHQAAHPEFPVVVRGDTSAAYQTVMDVLDAIGRLGITQVGLATKKEPAAKPEAELNLPVPPAGDVSARHGDELIIDVAADGSISLAGENLSQDTLKAKLMEAAKAGKVRPVIIRGEEAAKYGVIVKVLSTCHEAGLHNVSFATLKSAEAGKPGDAREKLEARKELDQLNTVYRKLIGEWEMAAKIVQDKLVNTELKKLKQDEMQKLSHEIKALEREINEIRQRWEQKRREQGSDNASANGKKLKLWSFTIPRQPPGQSDDDQLALAKELRKKLLNGADFESLARTHSADSKQEFGGHWGWIQQDDISRKFWDVISKLPTGQLSEVISIDGNHYIFRVESSQHDGSRSSVATSSKTESEIEAQLGLAAHKLELARAAGRDRDVDLGLFDSAVAKYREYMTSLIELERKAPESVPVRTAMALAHLEVGRLLARSRQKEAQTSYSQCINIYTRLLKEHSDDSAVLMGLMSALNEVVPIILAEHPGPEGARRALNYQNFSVISLRSAFSKWHSQSADLGTLVALSLVLNGDLQRAAGDIESARSRYKEAIGLTKALLERTELTAAARGSCESVAAEAYEKLANLAATPATAPDGTKPPAAPDAGSKAPDAGFSLTVLDSGGEKKIAEFRVIAGVKSQAGNGEEDVVNWQPHTVRIGRDGALTWPLDKAYDEMSLRIEADGYAPHVLAGLKKSGGPQALEVKLVEDTGTTGRVLTPDGKPAADATVALAMVQRDAVIEDGKLRHLNEPLPEKPGDRWRRPVFVKADGDGRFTLPPENERTAAVLIVHETGVRELALKDFQAGPEVTLQPWGRVEGKVQWGGRNGGDRSVSLTIHRDDYGYPGVVAQYEKTTSLADGSFIFERVLPGRAQLSCPIKIDSANKSGITEINLTGQIVHVTVQPGVTPVVIGGGGRTVKGKLTGRASWEGVTFHLHPTAPHVGFPGDDEMWKAWGEFQKSPQGPLFFRNGLKPNPDGTFTLEDMMPGDYQFFVDGGIGYTTFTVEPETPGKAAEVQDVGEIAVKP